MLATGDWIAANGADHTAVAQCRIGSDHRIGDVVVDRLLLSVPALVYSIAAGRLTECSSCLTSSTCPSLKVHLTMSVSGDAPLTYSDLFSADQNLEKSWSLMWCQTWDRGALMTAVSLMEVEVGIPLDILLFRVDCCVLIGI